MYQEFYARYGGDLLGYPLVAFIFFFGFFFGVLAWAFVPRTEEGKAREGGMAALPLGDGEPLTTEVRRG